MSENFLNFFTRALPFKINFKIKTKRVTRRGRVRKVEGKK